MAVYTSVDASELAELIDSYDIGRLQSYKGIAEGVENSNFLVRTQQNDFILTLYEKRVKSDDLPFFVSLLGHLFASNVPVPAMIADRSGTVIQQIAGRSACLIKFLNGISVTQPNAAQCAAVGKALAQMHLSLANFHEKRPNDFGIDSWSQLAKDCGDLDSITAGLSDTVKAELDFLLRRWPKNLPSHVIHGDLFPDNVLMTDAQSTKDTKITGLIDFYFAASDARAYDLAITHAAWSFSDHGEAFHDKIAVALMHGYLSVLPLTDDEITAFPVLVRGAALRFLLTRSFDWLNPSSDALVTRKSPIPFLRRLCHYQNIDPTTLVPARPNNADSPNMTNATNPARQQRVVIVATDGSCKGNPGSGGWAAVLRYGDVVRKISGHEANTTNNRMELVAAIKALAALKRSCRVELTTDSLYVRDGITKWIHDWERRGWKNAAKKPVANTDLWQQLKAQADRHEIDWKWVRGHSGHSDNELADQLASLAASTSQTSTKQK